MTESQFWEIIQRASEGRGVDEDRFQPLKAELIALPPDEILAFAQRFNAAIDAYTIDLWGAGYLINGGCSDDGFHYFRCWLIGLGRDVYARALANPDTLADVVNSEGNYESSLDSAPARAWEEKTGRSDEAFYAALEMLEDTATKTDEGDDWDFDDDDEMRRRLPRLFQLFAGGADDEDD